MLLRQISGGNPLTSLIVEGLEFAAPILRDAQFYARPGAADYLKQAREGTAQASYFRALNASANSPTAPTPAYLTPTKRIVSFDAKVDKMVQARGEAIENEIAHQAYLEAREAGWVLQEKMFEGDNGSVSTEFDGLRALVDSEWVFETGDGAGVVLQLGNSDEAVAAQQQAIEELLLLKRKVRGGATHFYMNDRLLSRWLTVAKHLGYYRQSKDELGNEVELIGDVIVRGVGLKADNTEILPFTETLGAASNCSSIFAVRWGERSDLTCLTTNGVEAADPYQSGNFWIVNCNMDMTIVLQDKTALVQSKGWRLSAA